MEPMNSARLPSINVQEQRVAVVAMELADSSAREIFRTMGQ